MIVLQQRQQALVLGPVAALGHELVVVVVHHLGPEQVRRHDPELPRRLLNGRVPARRRADTRYPCASPAGCERRLKQRPPAEKGRAEQQAVPDFLTMAALPRRAARRRRDSDAGAGEERGHPRDLTRCSWAYFGSPQCSSSSSPSPSPSSAGAGCVVTPARARAGACACAAGRHHERHRSASAGSSRPGARAPVLRVGRS